MLNTVIKIYRCNWFSATICKAFVCPMITQTPPHSWLELASSRWSSQTLSVVCRCDILLPLERYVHSIDSTLILIFKHVTIYFEIILHQWIQAPAYTDSHFAHIYRSEWTQSLIDIYILISSCYKQYFNEYACEWGISYMCNIHLRQILLSRNSCTKCPIHLIWLDTVQLPSTLSLPNIWWKCKNLSIIWGLERRE